MDGLIDIAAARALVSDAALWPRVRDFLWRFASRIHPSWLESVPGLSAHPGLAASPRVQAWILERLEVEPCFHAFPADDGSRLALLDSDTLQAVARWLGVLATADALRRVTRGPDVAALKAAFPDAYPAVFSYAAYFARSGILDFSSDTDPAAILSTGYSLLFSALARLPAPVLRRFRLELPRDPAIQRACESAGPAPGNLMSKTLPLLLKLVFPEAFSLCCS